MRRFFKRLLAVPHLFGKLMVVWCVAVGMLCSFGALGILARTGQDAAGLLAPILAFFGGELALMFGKNALQKKKEEKENGSDKCC